MIDIVFSLDSVITAVGLVQHVPVMVAAIVIAVLVMMVSAGTIADFIDKHPTLKILALSFLIVVGTLLIAEAFDVHVPKGLRLLRHGFLARRRGAEHPHAQGHEAQAQGTGEAGQGLAGLNPRV